MIRIIRRGVGPAVQGRRQRQPVYDEEVMYALMKICESLGYPCGAKAETHPDRGIGASGSVWPTNYSGGGDEKVKEDQFRHHR